MKQNKKKKTDTRMTWYRIGALLTALLLLGGSVGGVLYYILFF